MVDTTPPRHRHNLHDSHRLFMHLTTCLRRSWSCSSVYFRTFSFSRLNRPGTGAIHTALSLEPRCFRPAARVAHPLPR